MAQWTNQAYEARLKHETKNATNPKAIARLRTTLRDVEQFLRDTQKDPDEAGWCQVLESLVSAYRVVQRSNG